MIYTTNNDVAVSPEPPPTWPVSVPCLLGVASLIVGIVAPRSYAFIVPLFALGYLLIIARREPVGCWTGVAYSPVALALSSFLGFAMCSSLWSQQPVLAIQESTIALIMAIIGVLCIHAAQRNPNYCIRQMLIVSVTVGAVYLLIEDLSSNGIKWLLIDTTGMPPSMVVGSAYVFLKGKLVGIDPSVTNRTAVAIALLSLPATGAILRQLPVRRRIAAVGTFLVLCIAAVALSESETSKLALACGILTAAYAVLSGAWARRTVMLGWAIASLAVVPLFIAANHFELHKSKMFMTIFAKGAPKERLVIAQNFVSRLSEAPLLGHGAGISYLVGWELDAEAQRAAAANEPSPRARHPHNAFLQVWFELGMVGALLFAWLGIAIVSATRLLHTADQPIALGTFATGAAMLAPSYGLWQVWQLALITLAAWLLTVAIGPKRAGT